MVESCGMSVIKYALFIFNLAFSVCGIIIIVVGSVTLSDTLNFSVFDDSGTYGPAIVLIIAGSIIFVIAFFGCLGALRESHCMLITFAVLLLIIVCVQVAAGIAAAVSASEMDDTKFKDLLSKYADNSENMQSWDKLQSTYKCCGINSRKDWDGKANLPRSCCNSIEADGELDQAQCPDPKDKYVSKRGCYTVLKEEFKKNSKWIIGFGIGIAVLEVFGIVMACWLAAVIKREGSDPKE